MTRREIAILACKILALWLVAQAALVIPSLLANSIAAISEFARGPKNHWDTIASLTDMGLPAVGDALIGIFLWAASPWLAGKMVKDDPAPVTRPDINYDSVLSIALIAIGVYTFIYAFRFLCIRLITAARSETLFRETWRNPNWQGYFWGDLLTLAISLWLIFDSRGIAKIIHSLRRPDPEKSNSSESQPPADNV